MYDIHGLLHHHSYHTAGTYTCIHNTREHTRADYPFTYEHIHAHMHPYTCRLSKYIRTPYIDTHVQIILSHTHKHAHITPYTRADSPIAYTQTLHTHVQILQSPSRSDKVFMYYSTGQTWSNARSQCWALGLELATIISLEENNAIR